MDFKKYHNVTVFVGKILRNSRASKLGETTISADLEAKLIITKSTGRFALFPGYEKEFEGIPTPKYFSIVPPIANIPATLFLHEIGNAAILSQQDKVASNYFEDREFAKYANMVFNHMLTMSYWDERVYYRFVSLNEFMNSGGSLTYGEFLEQKQEVIDELFMNGTSKHYYHTRLLSFGVIKDGSFLAFRDFKNNKAISNLFFSMTVDEVRQVLDEHNKNKFFATSSSTSYSNFKTVFSRDFPKFIASIRGDKMVSPEGVRESLLTSFITSIDSFGVGRTYRADVLEEFLNNSQIFLQMYSYDSKVSLAESLESIASEITPIEFLSVMFAINNPTDTILATGSKNVAVRVLDEAFKNTDDKGSLASFVSQLVFDYDGKLPTQSEWSKSSKSGNEDYSLGPIIVMGLMSKQSDTIRKTARRVANFRKKYSDWAD